MGVEVPFASDELVYDVGMHKGEDTAFYLKKGFRVVAIEAMPDFCHEVAERFPEELSSGRLTIVNAALVSEAGPVDFYVNSNRSVWGTTRAAWAERNSDLGSPSCRIITVEGRTVDSIVEEYGVPYYMKIDVEGADMDCLDGLERLPVPPKLVSIESTKESWTELKREFDTLGRLGYQRFKVVPQHLVARQRCPRSSREGAYTAHRFETGASGLFGHDAPGRYLSRRAALLRYRFIFLRYWLYGDRGVLTRSPRLRPLHILARALLRGPGWYDTHASRPDCEPASLSNQERAAPQ